MKIRDSFSKETLKQFKSIAPNSNRKLDGTIIPLDEEFEIPESGERCMFPRDTRLSPKERVNCHCAVGLWLILLF